MPEKKEWRGIQLNNVEIQGEIIEDPAFSGEYAFMKLRTIVTQRDPNGQYVELDQIVPLMVEPGSPLLNVVQKFIKTGRKLHASGQFKSWEAAGATQYSITVSRIVLGDKPYEASPEGAVPMPPG